MGVRRQEALGPRSPKHVTSIIANFFKKVVQLLSEHGAVNETKTIMYHTKLVNSVSGEMPRMLAHSLLPTFLCKGMIIPASQTFGTLPEHNDT